MPDKSCLTARLALAALAAGTAAVITACGGGPDQTAFFPSEPVLVIEPTVTEATRIASGTVASFSGTGEEGGGTPFVEFQLAVPDGSPVHQFVAPQADFVVESRNSRQEVVGTPCRLAVGDGSRTFWAQHRLTIEQYNPLRSVTVTQVYE